MRLKAPWARCKRGLGKPIGRDPTSTRHAYRNRQRDEDDVEAKAEPIQGIAVHERRHAPHADGARHEAKDAVDDEDHAGEAREPRHQVARDANEEGGDGAARLGGEPSGGEVRRHKTDAGNERDRKKLARPGLEEDCDAGEVRGGEQGVRVRRGEAVGH